MAQILKEREFEALMYSEELYVAEILRLYNKKCFYDSSIEILHESETSTGNLNFKNKLNYKLESMKFIREKFYQKEN